MDGKRFDQIARLAARSPRRPVVRGAVAGGLGLLLGGRAAGAVSDYENRGQRCADAADCNAPCRACCGDVPGHRRCVYGCDDASQVCDAGQGLCVSRTDPTATTSPVCP